MAVAVAVSAALGALGTVLSAWIAARQQQVKRELNGQAAEVRELVALLKAQPRAPGLSDDPQRPPIFAEDS